MLDYPNNISEFEQRFATEDACRAYLFKLRWPEGFVCPRCNKIEVWKQTDGLYRCKSCQFKCSITSGTIFEGTRKPLLLWFQAIWYVVSQKNGASAKNIQRILELGSYQTAWTWLHKIRRAMVRPMRDNLSGLVEVDETLIGGKKPGKRGHRSVGPGVIEAFYHGYDAIDVIQFDFICKFDLDLELPPRYFEILIRRMNDNPRIGTCSGKPYFQDKKTGKLVSEKCGDEMSVGMTKFYRRICFEDIGGFVRQVMWDGIDCHKCRQLGWTALSWDEPDLQFIHLRPMGSSQQGIFTGRMRHGFGQYFMGTGLLYMTASSVFRLFHKPYFVGGFAMWWGYVKSLLKHRPRFDDVKLVRFIRDYQWQCLLKGKGRATEELNTKQATVWIKNHC